MKRHFCQYYIRVDSRHLQKCLLSLIIRETQIRSTVGYHLTNENGIYQKAQILSPLLVIWGGGGHLHPLGKNVILFSCCKKHFGDIFIKD